ncbi:MAG TPA: BTAD domain-containing putative transcriptional regulator, partial [Acidimicrobiales bacterium]|nr:BTAD domain-containing putative transcriptional regulator [Acidimicrobiales bacterium]
LLLTPGRAVPVAKVVESLWPEGTAGQPEDTTKTLRLYMSRLRQMLPPGALPRPDSRGYRLEVDGSDTDAGRFEELLAVGTRAGMDPARTVELLREALSLWRGPALDDCSDEPWATGTAVRLDEMRLTALERLNDARLAVGEHGQMCGELERLVDEHPLRERLWAQLMLAQYRSGRQADALRSYQRLRQRLAEGLGIDPSKELADLEGAILRQDLGLANPSDPAGEAKARGAAAGDRERRQPTGGTFPVHLNSFVGREREMEEVRSLLEFSRLVTLVGAGGVGKTRLAIEISETSTGGSFPAVYFADLAPLRADDEVARQLATVLGISLRSGGDAVESLTAALGNEPVLVVLDNCEHLVGACAVLSATILRSCPATKMLATSRQPLGIESETIYRVPSLGLPEPGVIDPVAVGEAEATRLFVERARAQVSSFQLDASNSEVVASLCRQLDGIPLALELGAARIRALSLQQISDLLDRRLRLLKDTTAFSPPRHRTLDALVSWSYEMLESHEKRLLRRLVVFSGPFDLEAVAVLCDPGADTLDSLDTLALLVDKSLVQAETSGQAARYSVLETIRQYAMGKLAEEEDGDALDALQRAHASYFLERADGLEPYLDTSEQLPVLDQIAADFDNYRVALSYLVGSGGSVRDAMGLLVAIGGRFATYRSRASQLLPFAEALVGRPELTEQRDELTVRFDLVLSKIGVRPESALERLSADLATARELGNPGLEADVQSQLAFQHWVVGDRDEAERCHRAAVDKARASGEYRPLLISLGNPGTTLGELLEALELSRSRDDVIGQFTALCNLGALSLGGDEPEAARGYLDEALPLMEKLRVTNLPLLNNLGTSLVLLGQPGAAEPIYVRALEAARRQQDARQIGHGLFGLALCAARSPDQYVRGAVLHAAARAQWAREGYALPGATERRAQEDVARLRGALGREYDTATAQGRALTRDEAIDLALGRTARNSLAGVT